MLTTLVRSFSTDSNQVSSSDTCCGRAASAAASCGRVSVLEFSQCQVTVMGFPGGALTRMRSGSRTNGTGCPVAVMLAVDLVGVFIQRQRQHDGEGNLRRRNRRIEHENEIPPAWEF